jgi:pimeloyl-ACP methyl ester carboxylesterase
MPEPNPFALHVDDGILVDLRQRLERTRWADEPPDATDWRYGTDLAYLQGLVDYWRTSFDWRKQEAALNAFSQFTANVAGIDLHFIHVKGTSANPIPLLLSHGWPGSVWEFHKIIPMLADRFTVVAPSLPGYTLSFRPGQPRFGIAEIGTAFLELMRDVLGYERFVAQGGDWGAFVSAYMSLTAPSNIMGIHLNLLPLLRQPDATVEDAAYREELAHWLREETGYSAIQGTKPQTLAFALTDSPVGLAAWILEKFHTWSDCDGDIERSFTKDELLTNIMLYWVTGAIGSSFWPYYVRQHGGWLLPSADRRVEVPTAYQSFPKDILHPPRALAERAFNLQRWTVAPRGGHFAALEEPELLAEDVREFASTLRR